MGAKASVLNYGLDSTELDVAKLVSAINSVATDGTVRLGDLSKLDIDTMVCVCVWVGGSR